MLTAISGFSRFQARPLPSCGCFAEEVDPQDTVTLSNPDINTTLPESGPGFRTYNRETNGVDQVGLPSTIAYVLDLGSYWAGRSEVPFQVGDISRQGGGSFPPHEGHKQGTEFDLRPFRKDGAMQPTNINDASYDRDRTRQFVLAAREKEPALSVLFNDPQLIKEGLTRYYKGHHNHLHFRLPGSTPESEGC